MSMMNLELLERMITIEVPFLKLLKNEKIKKIPQGVKIIMTTMEDAVRNNA